MPPPSSASTVASKTVLTPGIFFLPATSTLKRRSRISQMKLLLPVFLRLISLSLPFFLPFVCKLWNSLSWSCCLAHLPATSALSRRSINTHTPPPPHCCIQEKTATHSLWSFHTDYSTSFFNHHQEETRRPSVPFHKVFISLWCSVLPPSSRLNTLIHFLNVNSNTRRAS